MLAFRIGTCLAKLLLLILPRRWVERIRAANEDIEVFNYKTGESCIKPRMTLVEAVGATLLFDLALFGTDSWVINFLIKTFTNLQNSWDKPFKNPKEAQAEVTEFCTKLGIQSDPWVWSKHIKEYKSLNDFFTRTYDPQYLPDLGKSDVVAPACSIVSIYQNDDGLRNLLIKGCDYRIEDVGLPKEDLDQYKKNHIVIGYLSPSHYHRVHVPISGKIVHLKLECADALSASVKFSGGKFNLLNRNKRVSGSLRAVLDSWRHAVQFS